MRGLILMINKLIIFAGLYLALLVLFAQPAAAQNGIEVVDNRASPRFPESIEFNLATNSETIIERVTLNYGTNARNCQSGGSRQRIQFDPDTEVAVDWEWDLSRSGSLPPGAQVWWKWIINDAAGNELTTERQELLIVDDRHNWRNLSRGNVTIHWFEGNNAFGERILADTIGYLDQLSDQIGVQLSDDIQLWLYPTAADVRDAMVFSHDWTGAVAFSDYNIMIISLAPGNDDWAAEVIPHELTHLIVGMATSNCRGGRLPVWLNEGLATYAEGEASSKSLTALEEALQEERLPSLQSLADGFSAYGGSAGLAYNQSGAVVRYLIEAFGPEKMNALLTTIQGGLTIDRALEQVYDFDTDGLDARWRLAQGYAPTPTSEAANALAEATPTPVPTLVLGGVPLSATSTSTSVPATDTPIPASPTLAKTPTLAVVTATVDEVAAVTTFTPVAGEPAPTLMSGDAGDVASPGLPYLALGIGIFAVAAVTILFFVYRKGE